MDQLQNMAVFVQVAEKRSLRATARSLGVSTATVSSRMNALERQLGVVLIKRTTRALTLTEEGHEYLQHCVSILAQMSDFEYRLRDRHEQLRGRLRVSAHSTLANYLLIPLLADFFTLYPQINIALDYSPTAFGHADRNNNDVILRMGVQEDSSLVARALGADRIYTVASPTYLESIGKPNTPSELSRHRCIGITIPDTGRIAPWIFEHSDGLVELEVQSRLIVNTGEGRLHATLANLGVAQLPAFQASPSVKAGSLIRLLPDWEAPTPQLVALYDKAQQHNPRLRAFIEYLLLRLPEYGFATP